MKNQLAVTVIGPDRPGIINQLSEIAARFGANWMESHMANLAGQFAGIVQLEVDQQQAQSLVEALLNQSDNSLQLSVTTALDTAPSITGELVSLELTGQDHPGIIRDISRVLTDNDISIEELETEYYSASMSGEQMFTASAELIVPPSMNVDQLGAIMQTLSDSLMVDIDLEPLKKPGKSASRRSARET